MRTFIFLTLLLAIYSVSAEQYIVTFSEEIVARNQGEKPHYIWLQGIIDQQNILSGRPGVLKIVHKYAIGQYFKGYTARLSSDLADQIWRMPGIANVELDITITLSAVQKNAPSWGLSRISHRKQSSHTSFKFPDSAGEGVHAYVIDTGIFIEHPEFEGRAEFGATFTEDGELDQHGHGTHTSGTIASKEYGVAKKANVIAVKVLDRFGSGSASTVMAGINWTANNIIENDRIGKAVASMSIGGEYMFGINKMVAAGVKMGIPFAVSAGNNRFDACEFSPASEPLAFTIAASSLNDESAPFSNSGKCVDLYAPGVNITSTWIAPQLKKTLSGTSMAAPHVAGVFALLMAEKKFKKASEVYDTIKRLATPNILNSVPKKTINLLLYASEDLCEL